MGNVYLIGMMGCGKTSTGKALAKFTKHNFIDLDQKIEERHNSTVDQIFATKGEPFFREAEQMMLEEIVQQDEIIVATGGGIILNPKNIKFMRKTGSIVYLKTKPETLWQRVKANKDRPLLKTKNPQETLNEIFEARKALYEETADSSIDTDGLTPEVVARRMILLLGLV